MSIYYDAVLFLSFALLMEFFQYCSGQPLPLLIGGYSSDSYIQAIDIDSAGNIVAGGKSSDPGLVSRYTFTPFVQLVTGSVNWAKEIDSSLGNGVSSIRFSYDYSKIAIVLESSIPNFVTLNVVDGSISKFAYGTTTSIFTFYPDSILVDSTEVLYIVGKARISNIDNWFIMSYSTIFNYGFTQQTGYAYSAMFGEDQTQIFIGGAINGCSTFSFIQASTGSQYFTYRYCLTGHAVRKIGYVNVLTDNHISGCSDARDEASQSIGVFYFYLPADNMSVLNHMHMLDQVSSTRSYCLGAIRVGFRLLRILTANSDHSLISVSEANFDTQTLSQTYISSIRYEQVSLFDAETSDVLGTYLGGSFLSYKPYDSQTYEFFPPYAIGLLFEWDTTYSCESRIQYLQSVSVSAVADYFSSLLSLTPVAISFSSTNPPAVQDMLSFSEYSIDDICVWTTITISSPINIDKYWTNLPYTLSYESLFSYSPVIYMSSVIYSSTNTNPSIIFNSVVGTLTVDQTINPGYYEVEIASAVYQSSSTLLAKICIIPSIVVSVIPDQNYTVGNESLNINFEPFDKTPGVTELRYTISIPSAPELEKYFDIDTQKNVIELYIKDLDFEGEIVVQLIADFHDECSQFWQTEFNLLIQQPQQEGYFQGVRPYYLPYFLEQLDSILLFINSDGIQGFNNETIESNSYFIYSLPEVSCPNFQNGSIEISVNLQSAFTFVTFDDFELKFILYPSFQSVGYHVVIITLVDESVPDLEPVTYYLNVTICKLEDIQKNMDNDFNKTTDENEIDTNEKDPPSADEFSSDGFVFPKIKIVSSTGLVQIQYNWVAEQIDFLSPVNDTTLSVSVMRYDFDNKFKFNEAVEWRLEKRNREGFYLQLYFEEAINISMQVIFLCNFQGEDYLQIKFLDPRNFKFLENKSIPQDYTILYELGSQLQDNCILNITQSFQLVQMFQKLVQ